MYKDSVFLFKIRNEYEIFSKLKFKWILEIALLIKISMGPGTHTYSYQFY